MTQRIEAAAKARDLLGGQPCGQLAFVVVILLDGQERKKERRERKKKEIRERARGRSL
jgi:hypothetical protein